MNWWLLSGGLMASICAAGHGIAGKKMFYRPIKASIVNETTSIRARGFAPFNPRPSIPPAAV